MTKEEFMLIISGFESEPFCIRTSEGWSDILKYRSVISDAVCAISNGKPHMFSFSEIAELSFDLKCIPSNEKNEIVSECLSRKIDCKSENDFEDTGNFQLLKESEKIIQLHCFEVQNRRETIRANVKGTPIEKHWSRVDSMLNDAVKNHALAEKKDEILAILDNLNNRYPCIELRQMNGIVYVKLEDFDNASYQFELAGDFQNAAAYAAMCGANSNSYLFEVFYKWIQCEPKCDDTVYSSFFATAFKLRKGKMCAKVIEILNIANFDSEKQNVIYYGLIRVLANYLPPDKIIVSGKTQKTEQIKTLIEKLKSASEFESDDEYSLPDLNHISDLIVEKNAKVNPLTEKEELNESKADNSLIQNDDGSYSGYIIKYIPDRGFGFIGKEPNSVRGVYFSDKSLDDFLSKMAPNICGRFVKCVLEKVEYSWDEQYRAVKIEYIGDKNKDAEVIYPNVTVSEVEKVNENAIKNKLKHTSPSSVVQFYATHNKPLHALAALEISKDSFSYDKYVKHKIQLLQRTKSDDNELVKLLKYTINASSDISYKSHNLYFLGQVEYRLERYDDVVETIKQFQRYSHLNKNAAQIADSVYLMAMAYYMLRDYSNSDKYAKELLNLNQHTIEAQRLLDRTFTADNGNFILSGTIDSDNLQLDMDVELTPFIDGLISDFSFGDISLKDIPSDFDPWHIDGYTIEDAKNLERKLHDFSEKNVQMNNPNAFIARAKLLKWMIQKMADSEKQKAEKQLRQVAYIALSIISRRQLEKSNQEKRVYPFYCMQQYKMSSGDSKKSIFSRFIMFHYLHNAQINSNIKQIKVDNPPHNNDYGDIVIDLLIFRNMMEEECDENIKNFCCIIEKRSDVELYKKVLIDVAQFFGICNNGENIFQQLLMCSESFNTWLKDFQRYVRTAVRSEQWEELLIELGGYVEFPYLVDRETGFIRQFIRVVDEMNSISQNTRITPQERSLMNCKLIIKQLQDDLKNYPTYILYSVFFDVIGIINNNVITKLGEITSYYPDIISTEMTQMKVGLSKDMRFRLPLELENRPPAVQASKMHISVISMSEGIEIVPSEEEFKNVDEGAKFSNVMIFSVKSDEITQAEIIIQVEYVYSVYNVMKQDYEAHDGKKEIRYTISFEDVLPITNKYSKYAKQQAVTDSSMFFGRKEVIEKLFNSICEVRDDGINHLKGGNGIVLYGQRRSGKSSIMYHLKKKIQHEVKRSIIVDFGSLRRVLVENTIGEQQNEQMLEEDLQKLNAEMTLGNMFYSITSGIEDYIEYEKNDNPDIMELSKRIEEYTGGKSDLLFPSKNDYESASANIQLHFNDFLRKFKRIANVDDPDRGFRLVIMIDEFTYFNKAIENHFLPDSFMESWKALVSDSFMTMIVAGQDNMVEFIDKYVNEFSSFQTMWVTFLKEEDAYQMVTEPIGSERITPDAAYKLCRFTAGSPFLLMDVCSQLVDWMNRTSIVKLSGSLPDDFLTTYMNAYEFKEDLLEPQYKDAGKLDWTDSFKLVLGLIARNTSKKVQGNHIPWIEFDEYAEILPNMLSRRGISEEQMQEMLERLEKRQVIEKETGTINKYRITIPLCREWILRRGGEAYGNAE